MEYTVNKDNVKIFGDEQLAERIISAIKEVYDPEIPVNIYDLGLIYEVHARKSESGRPDIRIVMTITAIGCPVGGAMAAYVEESIREALPDAENVEVEVVFDPPWTPERVTAEGRELLKAMYGYDVVEQWSRMMSQVQGGF